MEDQENWRNTREILQEYGKYRGAGGGGLTKCRRAKSRHKLAEG